jgi:coenzyme F420-0:L-glutamate ligase/coenzyme F420-1:gamma-L-glutamate ligase
MLGIFPLAGLPEIRPGDDLPALLAAHLAALQAGDILVVAQKIVSKAEGRFVTLGDVVPSPEAVSLAEKVRKDARLVELVLRESSEVVRAAPNVLITRQRLGHVMANAGIDASNIGSAGEDRVLLLPEDPDASAARIADALAAKFGVRPGVVISDSFGRPWRMGTVNVAIGIAGMPALIDRRGERDRDGRVMQMTLIALADAVAAAAGLAMGEGAEGVPAAVVRGLDWAGAAQTAGALLRPVGEDLFR